MNVRGIHHFALVIRDMDSAIDWYGDVLDLKLEKRWEAGGVEFAHVARDSLRFELFAVAEPAASPDNGKDVFGALASLGPKHVGLLVGDIAETERHLRDKNVEIILGPQDVPPVNVRNLFIRDQDGNQFEFVQLL